MEIHQLRNATIILSFGGRHILVDPMLAPAGSMPGFKLFGGGRRPNPLVELPSGSEEALERVTEVLITHEHPDHLDPAGLTWIRSRDLPVWSSSMDLKNLRRKGLRVRALEDGGFAEQSCVVPSRHGRGLLGWMLGPVQGVYFATPGEPSVYLCGDAVLTPSLLNRMRELNPDLIVAPAGAANVGVGGPILFTEDELIALARTCEAQLVFNHLEALDHCPTTRTQLRARLEAEGLLSRSHVPEDGELIHISHNANRAEGSALRMGATRRPGPQKWVTSLWAGT